MLPAVDTFNQIRDRVVASYSGESVRGRFLRGSSWSLIGMTASQALALLAAIVAARLLGKEGFGELGMINSTVGMLSLFGTMGLGATASKYVAELRSRDPERAGRIIGLSSTVACILGSLMTVGLFFAAPTLAAKVIKAPQLADKLRIASFLLVIVSVSTAQTGALGGLEAFRSLAQVNLAGGALSSVFMIGGLLVAGLAGAVAGQVAAGVAGVLIGTIALRRECRCAGVPIRRLPLLAESRVLWDFSIPSFLCGSMASPVFWLTQVMLANRKTGYAELGLFNAANQWRSAISFLPLVLAQPLLPILSNVRKLGHRSQYVRLFRASVYVTFGLSTGAALAVILASKTILKAYGHAFSGGESILVLLVLAAVVNSVAVVAYQAIISFGRMWGTFGLSCLWAAVLLGSALLLVPNHGAFGLAAAILISYVAQGGMLALYTTWVLTRELRTEA